MVNIKIEVKDDNNFNCATELTSVEHKNIFEVDNLLK